MKLKITHKSKFREPAKIKIMNRERILGLVRHILTAFGGGLVVSGKIDAQQLELAAGAIITIAGVVWSVLAPEKN